MTDEEAASWRDAATSMHVPYDEELDVHQQVEGFTRLQEWDFTHTPAEKYPLLLHYPYFELYRKQVVKQADLVLAMHWRGRLHPEQKVRNFLYYERRTVRDSSLSACTQAVLAAEVGHPELAHLPARGRADGPARPQREHPRRRTHGVVGGRLAGSGQWARWSAGPRRRVVLRPRLSSRLSRLEFSLQWRGCPCGWMSGRTRRHTRCATVARTTWWSYATTTRCCG
ncbi:hypothetical protein NKG94_32405 [Micromonospora sp. M12]